MYRNFTGRVALVFVLLSLFISTGARAESGTKNVDVWVDAFAFLRSKTIVGGDIKIIDHFTVGGAYTHFKATGLNISMTSTGYGGYLRYYFDKAIASGFRISAFYFSTPVDMSFGVFSAKFNSSEYGGMIGYHYVPNIFSIGFDVGYENYTTAGRVTLTDSTGQTTTVATPGFSGSGIAAQGTLGFAF